jgi:signal transduction histidine kinase
MQGLGGYLGDRPIWFKLGLIMIVPTIATIVVGISALLTNIGAASDADRARTLTSLTADSGSLVHDLQNERAAAVDLLAFPEPNQSTLQNLATAYKAQFAQGDAAAKTYREQRNALTGLPDSFTGQLNSVDSALAGLPNLRNSVISGNNITLTSALQSYGSLISSLLTIRTSSAQLAVDQNLSYEMQVGAALAKDKEFLAQERVVGLQSLLTGTLEISNQQQFIETITAQGQALTDYRSVATPDQIVLLNTTFTGPDVREREIYEGDFRAWLPDQKKPDNLASPEDWDSAFVGNANLLRQVEQRLDDRTVVDATSLHNRVQSQVLVEAGLLLSLVLVAVLVAWFVARSMNRSLRELRHGALAIAQYGLPQAVARLRDPSLSGQMSPQQLAAQIAEPLPVHSKDEFGQVTEAFNAVHLEAVRTAAEQAALRSSVSTMFVNLARRSQILVDRLIGHLDRLERGEEDPDRLAELFQLDHLATRMRRNDENLLVLAGADSTRVQREPAALIDVLRAAQSEVEHYTRIEFGVIDRDIEVDSHAVNDLVHLVAELFDNATAFSPPDSSVIVEARRVGDRGVLYVEDHGIGISNDQLADLNERLATPPEVDVAVSRMMGLVVVARLAARHGVKVELRPAHERGTIADVTLPTTALVARALSGRTEPGSSIPGEPTTRPRQDPPVPQQRNPFGGAPLALPSGPTGGVPAGAGAGPGNGFSGPNSGFGGPGNGGFGGNGNGFGGNGARGGGLGSSGSDTYTGGLAATSGAPAGSRNLPAWSDLTGASGIVNGARSAGDAFTPRRPDDPGTGPLPQRRSGETEGDENAGPGGPRPGTAPSGPEAFRDRQIEGEIASPTRPDVPPNGARSYPGPSVAGGAAGFAVPPPAPPRMSPPTGAPPPPAWPPPAWPPMQPEGSGEDSTAPPVPEALAAALDITSEIPRIRERDEDAAATSAVPAAYVPPALVGPVPEQPDRRATQPPRDETMELPIFQELESAWFRSRSDAAPGPTGGPRTIAEEGATDETRSIQGRPATPVETAPAETAPAAPNDGRTGPAPAPVNGGPAEQPGPRPGYVPEPEPAPAASDLPRRPTPSTDMPMRTAPEPVGVSASERMSVPNDPGWRTAADEGWDAARAAAAPEVVATTNAGLPKRVPMAQLVPGGVEKPQPNTNRRSPEQVRGLLSAYHRGVQRGRGRNGDEIVAPDSHTSTGHPLGGKEQQE